MYGAHMVQFSPCTFDDLRSDTARKSHRMQSVNAFYEITAHQLWRRCAESSCRIDFASLEHFVPSNAIAVSIVEPCCNLHTGSATLGISRFCESKESAETIDTSAACICAVSSTSSASSMPLPFVSGPASTRVPPSAHFFRRPPLLILLAPKGRCF